jgi:hypothetical protein
MKICKRTGTECSEIQQKIKKHRKRSHKFKGKEDFSNGQKNS